MCVITTALGATVAGFLSSSAVAATSTAAAFTTAAMNAAVGAAASAGIAAASGARGRDLWTAAAIGGAAGGAGSLMSTGLGTSQAVAATGTGNMATQAGGAAAQTSSALDTQQLVSLGIQGVSGGVEAYGNYEQGKQEEKALKEQAKLDQIRAGQVQDAATLEKQDLARRQRQTTSSGRAAAAANGVLLESRAESAPAVWEQDAAEELAYESSKIDYNANLQAWGYNQSARTNLINARNARRTGNLRVATSLIKAGAGMASSYAMYNYGSAKQPTISFG